MNHLHPPINTDENTIEVLREHLNEGKAPPNAILHKLERAVSETNQVLGFPNKQAFEKAMLIGNRWARKLMGNYMKVALPSLLFGHNGSETPHIQVQVPCADGRIKGPENFAKDPGVRFSTIWQPAAGGLVSQRLITLAKGTDGTVGERLQKVLEDSAQVDAIVEEMYAIYGPTLQRQLELSEAAVLAGKLCLQDKTSPDGRSDAVAKLASTLMRMSGKALRKKIDCSEDASKHRAKITSLGKLFPVSIEFHSHSISGTDEHGCGAHNCNVQNALTMSILNGIFTRKMIERHFPQHQDILRVALAHHYTGNDEKIVNIHRPELCSRIDPSLMPWIDNGQFTPRFHRKPEGGIVREKKADTGGNREHHNEYIIRFSQEHKAHGLSDRDVLEESIIPDVDLMQTKVRILIEIIQANRLKGNPMQPIFLHLDAPANNPKQSALYEALHERVQGDETLQPRIASGQLIIVRSTTKPLDFKDPDHSLETTFSISA